MRFDKTTIILGAGASKEFDLPTGIELQERIFSILEFGYSDYSRFQPADPEFFNLIVRYCSRLEIDESALTDAAARIRSGLPLAPSIDNFLDARRDDEYVIKLGKLAIAYCILKAESKSRLFQMSKSNSIRPIKVTETWLAEMFKIICQGNTKESLSETLSNITFIIFNYDRCIEEALPRMISVYFGIDLRESYGIADQVTIIHPYGSLGDLDRIGIKDSGFGAVERLEDLKIKQMSEKITLFTEKMQDFGELESISEALEHSALIIFLGFGFHRQNIEILGNSKAGWNAREIIGTRSGISDTDHKVVEEILMSKTNMNTAHNPKIDLRNMHCRDFFREFRIFLSER